MAPQPRPRAVAESEMFIDYIRQGHATHHYAEGHTTYGYRLMWAIVTRHRSIILYMEMCGRILAVAKEPVFSVVRTRLGFPLGLVTLIVSIISTKIYLRGAAELGGIAYSVLHLVTAWPENRAHRLHSWPRISFFQGPSAFSEPLDFPV